MFQEEYKLWRSSLCKFISQLLRRLLTGSAPLAEIPTHLIPLAETHAAFMQRVRYCFSVLTKTEICEQTLVKLQDITCHKILVSSCRVVTCRQAGTIKLTGTFLQLLVANAPTKGTLLYVPNGN
jgi:hypothetical protein